MAKYAPRQVKPGGRACRVCGKPVNSGNEIGICTRTNRCVRMRSRLTKCKAMPESEVTYLVWCEDFGAYKIGHTKDVETRLKMLTLDIKAPVRLLATFPGGRALECSLHDHLSRYQRPPGREWFDLPVAPEGAAAYISELVAEIPIQKEVSPSQKIIP